jgi:aryl-phospho-beta-D-glucosidase BglC (GH1 family)
MSRSAGAAQRPGYTVAAAISMVMALMAIFVVWTSPAAAEPVRYEAEEATISQGAVESNHAGFSGTGFVNYNAVSGSYVEWTVKADAAGTATLVFGYANGTTASRPMDISVGGDVVREDVAFPGTGAWTTYRTVTTTVELAAGENTIRAAATVAAGGPNADYLDVEMTGPPPPPPTEFQAENATISQGVVESNHAGFTGTGFVNYNNASGSYVEWTVPAAAAGEATIAIRYANGAAANRPMDISVNGELIRDELAFPATGAWTTWRTVTTTVPLEAKQDNKIRAAATTAMGGPNVDKLDATGGGDPGDKEPPTAPTGLNSTGKTATSVSLAWTASTDNVGVTGYEVFRDGSSATTATGTTATVSGLSPSTAYRFTVKARDAAGNTSGFSNEITVTTESGGGGSTPVEINGKLHVCGTKLCNQYGKPIQLRGMSTHGLQWHYNCINNASLDALAGDWKADILRISMYIQEGGYETNPRLFTDRVHSIIEQVTARGMYFIVDWHQLSPGDPHYNLARARTFFTEIAQRHGNKPNILYEVANEPSGVSWSRIRDYHHAIIPTIRAQDPDSVILLGTRAWSSLGVSDGGNEQEVISNPVNASNVMYTFHFYAASHGANYRGALSRAADRIPMFVTEYGTQTFTGGGGNDFGSSQQYIDLMAQKKISWTNWNYSHDPLSGAAFTVGTCPGGPFAGTSRLKPAGNWVRNQLRLPDDFPTG